MIFQSEKKYFLSKDGGKGNWVKESTLPWWVGSKYPKHQNDDTDDDKNEEIDDNFLRLRLVINTKNGNFKSGLEH